MQELKGFENLTLSFRLTVQTPVNDPNGTFIRTKLNKAIAQKLSGVIHTQLRGLMETLKTTAE